MKLNVVQSKPLNTDFSVEPSRGASFVRGVWSILAKIQGIPGFLFFILLIAPLAGCNFIPDIKHKPQYHNPFPQISKVAVLPFRNQSQEPTLSGARVSMAYYNELQAIRGFEVIPFGVVENQLANFETNVLQHPLMSPVDFQQFAKHLGVDAVLQGAVTDYDPYYPPRMTIKVNWYASNPGFHPIPVGYGLPWGTKAEKKIPEWIRLESERALAAEQMKTQSPVVKETAEAEVHEPNAIEGQTTSSSKNKRNSGVKIATIANTENKSASLASHSEVTDKQRRIAAARITLPIHSVDAEDHSKVMAANAIEEPPKMPEQIVAAPVTEVTTEAPILSVPSEELPFVGEANSSELPEKWPDPQGFIPPRPTSQPPEMRAQYEPIISHMRTYNGNDEDFTHALGEYFYFRDDARFGGWQSYLQRSEDFIRFCCHQHIVETLASRGGELESRMIVRWPINRYER